MPLKFTPTLLKNNCIVQFVILSILSLILFITIYFAFDDFLSLAFFFNFISRHFFQFDFYIQFGLLLLIVFLMCFILILINFFFQFHPLLFYCIF
jgi:hypothetical protein